MQAIDAASQRLVEVGEKASHSVEPELMKLEKVALLLEEATKDSNLSFYILSA